MSRRVGGWFAISKHAGASPQHLTDRAQNDCELNKDTEPGHDASLRSSYRLSAAPEIRYAGRREVAAATFTVCISSAAINRRMCRSDK
jgi:hypothetical protein